MLIGRCLIATYLLLPVLVLGQEFRATITGRVIDPRGSTISGCAVQVNNVNTNEMTTTKTDSAGVYTVPFLRPGSYSMTFEAPGFKKLMRDGISLDVGQTAGIDVKLELGTVTESVTVTGEIPLIETEKADRGLVIDTQQIVELPMNGRNPYLLAILAPGSNFNGEARFLRPFDLPHSWRMNGGLNQNNEFLLDGAPNNAQAGNNSVGLVPPVDAVQEFKVQTSSYDAQYGKTSGGIINVSLKSGTNDFHGTVYEFTRRSAWDANTYALNFQDKPRQGHYLWESGGTLGGPVILPKLYDGKNKTFFFFSYEDWRESTPETGFHSVPAPEMIDQADATKCGGVPHCADFSNLAQFNKTGPPTPILIYEPLSNPTGRTPISCNGMPNVICFDRVNAIARKILGFFPAPNNLNNPNSSFYTNNDFFRNSLDKDKFYNWAFKVDQNIGTKHHLFVTGGHNLRHEFRQFNPVPIGKPGENAQDPIERINYVSTLDWVTTVNPTLIANIRIGWNRNVEGFHDLPNENFDLTTLGFPASMVSQLALPKLFGDYTFNDYTSLGRLGSDVYTNNFTIHPSITKIYGNHSFKSGLDFRLIVYNQVQPGEHDVFRLDFSRDFTRRVWNSDDPVRNGNSIASFLLGYPGDRHDGSNPPGGQANIRNLPSTVWHYYAPYIQDDWKITRTLSLNLGLRVDFNVSPYEKNNRIDRGFDPTIVNPEDGQINHIVTGSGGTFVIPQLKGGLLFANVNGVPQHVANLNSTTIQPRIGFAYQAFPKFVFRGGFGRYYMNPNNDYLQYNGFNQRTDVPYSLDNGMTPNLTSGLLLNNPFPSGLVRPPGSSIGARTSLGQGFDFFNPHFRIPYIDQFSFGFQYELPRQSSLDISYVGSRGHKLQTRRPFNEPPLSLRQQCDPAEGATPSICAASFANPFRNLTDFKGTNLFTATTVNRWDLSRRFPQFSGITERGRNDGRTWYNSMQINYRVRASRQLNLSASYTWSKNMEQALPTIGDGWLDVQKNIQNRGLTNDDQPDSLKIGSIWELPIGNGQPFLNTSNRFWSRVVSGWEHTMILTYVSGRPAELPSGSVVYQKNAKLSNIDWSKPTVQGWAPCVAIRSQSAPFALSAGPAWDDALCGNRNDQAVLASANFLDLNLPGDSHNPRFTPFRDSQLRLQSKPTVDMSLNKTTKITERASIQFRAEAFNLFNTFRFFRENFNNDTRSQNFGKIIKGNISDGSNVGFPRQIQLALKIVF